MARETRWQLGVNVNEEIPEQLKQPLALGLLQIKTRIFLKRVLT
jgi:hypothetical protein